MHDFLVSIRHRDGDRIGTMKATALSAAAAASDAVDRLIGTRPIPRSAYRTTVTALPAPAPVPALS